VRPPTVVAGLIGGVVFVTLLLVVSLRVFDATYRAQLFDDWGRILFGLALLAFLACLASYLPLRLADSRHSTFNTALITAGLSLGCGLGEAGFKAIQDAHETVRSAPSGADVLVMALGLPCAITAAVVGFLDWRCRSK